MKLCTFLKSRMESVRRATREILQKIMITLGPKYLPYLLKETNTLLTKGFQVHVLAYTVQSVLSALKPYFQKYDINNNLQSILSVSIAAIVHYKQLLIIWSIFIITHTGIYLSI